MAAGEQGELGLRIAGLLRGAGLSFTEKPSLRGVQPDFLVEAPDGRRIVVEAKAWDPTAENQAHAIEQARLYQDAVGADRAFVVLPSLARGRPEAGLVGEAELVSELLAEIERGGPRRRRAPTPPETGRTLFAAMPFAPEYEDVFFVAMAGAARTLGAVCQRVDRREFTGDVVAEVHRLIRESTAVICDLSESKPNVLYETGYAHALDKPAIHICSTPMEKLPFDVRNWNTLPYVRGQTHRLTGQLRRRLKALL